MNGTSGIVIFVLVGLLTAAGVNAQEANLLANPSFEKGEVGKAPPEWDFYNKGEGKRTFTTAPGGHSGKQEARFSKEDPIEWVYAGQTVSAPIATGEIYRYSGWLKAAAPVDVTVNVLASTAAGQPPEDAYKVVKVDSEWKRFEVMLKIKKGPFTAFRVSAQVLASGATVSFDDAELVKMPTNSKPGESVQMGPTAADYRRMIEPTDETVSPHIAWSKPAAAGPLHVLFITYCEGMREIVELRERFELNVEVFATQTTDDFAASPQVQQSGGAPEWSREAREARLRDLLSRDYDVIVVGNIRWNILPDWARAAVLAKVKNGTGLFGFIPRGGLDDGLTAALKQPADVNPRAAIPAFPYAGLPAYRGFWDFDSFAQGEIQFAQDGKGRIALMRYRLPEGSSASEDGIRVPFKQTVTPEIVDPFPRLYMVDYDYYLALAGHLMNWVAGRTPPVRVVEPPLNAQSVQREAPEPLRAELESDSDRNVTVQWAIREFESGQVWKQKSEPLALRKGRNEFLLPMVGLPSGTYFADLWVKDHDKTIGFGSLLAEVSSSAVIRRIDPAAESFLKSEPIQGTVTLEGAKPGQVVQITQVDNQGRQVARQNLPVTDGAGRLSFRLEARSPLSVIQTLEARLLDGPAVLDLKRATVTYRDLFPPNDIRCIVAQGYEGDSYLNVTLADSLRKAGLDTLMTNSGDTIFSYDDLRDTPYYRFVRPRVRVDAKGLNIGAGLMGDVYSMPVLADGVDGQYDWYIDPRGEAAASARGVVRRPCLSNAAYLRKCADYYSGLARDLRKFAIPDYDLGDECRFLGKGQDGCFDDASIRAFQDYVRTEYGTIQRLNEEYGSSYERWDQVIPIPFDEAKKQGKVPMWVDHRRHMETVWAGYFKRAFDAIAPEAPGAHIGYEGSDEPGHTDNPIIGGAENYYLLAHSMTMNGTYYFPLQLDCIRDFSAPGTLIGGGWFGGYPALWRAGRESLTQHWWLWNTLLRGANSLWIFNGCNIQTDGHFSVLAPDFSPHDFFRPTIDQMLLARRGVGKLLMSCDRPDDGIAVLYSPSSMLMTAFTDGLPERMDSVAAASFLFTEAGFQYRMIASPQLEDGILRQRKFRALYLPFCQALSPKEVAEIQAFARAGGLVLADLRPAVADGHGKAYAKGPLDDLFGVAQNTQKAAPLKASVQVVDRLGGLGNSLPGARLDASLRAAAGKAYGKAGDAPALIVNNYGKGLGILLNLALSDYIVGDLVYGPEFEDETKAAATHQLVQAMLAMQGTAPPMPIEPYVPGLHVFRFADGEEHVLGLVWDAPCFLPGTRWTETDKQSVLAALSKKVTLDLGAPCHVYDMRTGAYLGREQKVERTLSPGSVDLLAALPYKIEGVNVEFARPVALQGQPLDYTVSLNAHPGPGKSAVHIFRIEFTDPDGAVAESYSLNATANEGAYRGTLSTCLNEKTGKWKVTVKDVQSGVTGSASFTVKANG